MASAGGQLVRAGCVKRMHGLQGVPATGEEGGGKINWRRAARCFPWLIFGEVNSERAGSEGLRGAFSKLLA